MIVYLLLLILCIITALSKRARKIMTFITLLYMILLSAFRCVGTDWQLYKTLFTNRIFPDRFEVGFKWLMEICSKIFNGNYFSLTFIVALITICVFYFAISKNSRKIEVSLLLFVLLGFYTKSFNIMKQMMAVSIAFYGIKYIIKRDLLKYCVTIIIASLFHKTALIMIPFYWLSNLKINKKVIIITIIISIISFLSFNSIFSFITLHITQYSVYSSYNLDIDAGYGTILNIAFYSLIILFLSFNYKKLVAADANNKYYLNIVLFSIPIMVLALNNVLFFRVALYPLIYLTVILNQYDLIFVKEQKKFVVVLVFPILIAYFILSIYYFGGIYPYESILNY